MVLKCCVCKIQSDDQDGASVSFHKLPAREPLREEWLTVLRQHGASTSRQYLSVCSQHFEKHCFQYTGMCERRKLRSGSVPTIFPDVEEVNRQELTSNESSGPARQLQNINEIIQVDNEFKINETNDVINSTTRLQEISIPQPESIINVIEFNKQEAKIARLQRENKNLKRRLGTCRRKFHHFKHLFKALRWTKYMSDDQNAALEEAITLDDRPLFEKIRNYRRTNGPLPTFLRTFACTLHFYSHKAYTYVRKTFLKCLPHSKTISKWYTKIHIGSGVSKAVIEAIKRKVTTSELPTLCNLVFDEMSIKKKVETVCGTEYGFVDLGKGDVAENVMVCMLVCITSHWKVPISYHFIKSPTAEEKQNMVNETLKTIHETGVKIVSLTFDGPKTNLSMCKLLGANLTVDEDMLNYFTHPITKKPIFTIIDACHCLKCIRNSVAKDDKTMLDSEGNIISWSYIHEMVLLQNKYDELYLAHKVTSEHMRWQDNKMNVRIAAQTFSQSVSDALHYLECDVKNPMFNGATGTARFCKIINDAFDLLNSRTLYSKNPSKIGISSSNIETVEKRVEIIVEYIKNLKYIDGQRVVDSQRNTGFIGMIIGLNSAIGIFKYYIQQDIPNGYLLTYKLSQDHLEIFFSAVRSKGGYNNNPTCRLFTNIFKQLLIHTDVKGSDNANCLAIDGTVTSDASDILTNVVEENNNNVTISTDKEIIGILPVNDLYLHNAIPYTAGFVCRKLLKMTKCYICPILLTHQRQLAGTPESKSEYKCRLIDLKNRGSLIYPSFDVVTICKITERIFRKYYCSQKSIYKTLTKLAQDSIPQSCLQLQHSLSENISASEHRSLTIKRIISIYLQLRINKLEHEKQKPEKKLRRRYTKYISNVIVKQLLFFSPTSLANRSKHEIF